ncbi:AAA domain-containing protein [Streptomyces sp. NPDC048483]|uniref:AAA domain-containing protein n=1 Tax=Streptomyces sp. NPDC048483 TaxID=3154927 RepID=UPI003437B17A
MSGAGKDTDRYAELVDRLFCRKATASYGPYKRIDEPVVVLQDRLMRVRMQTPGDDYETFEMSLFADIHKFAGELWEHEVRSLLRLQALNHPALPEITDGSFDATESIAFTMTKENGSPLDIDWAVSWAQEHRIAAFEQFSVLVDALSQLHGSGILHRNLTLGALRVHTPPHSDAAEHLALSLERFEMSTLIGNLLRAMGSSTQADEAQQSIRQLYLTPPKNVEPARHLAYLAPETHPSLFEGAPSSRRDWDTTDVFGLGVLGFELFCGPIHSCVPVEYAAVAVADDTGLRTALNKLHRAMRTHLANRPELPGALTRVLRSMLEPTPKSRITSYEAARRIEQDWEAVCGFWEDKEENQRPHLVAFMPDESVETIYKQRNWISRSPDDAAGREELRAFFEKELRQAELVRSPNGAFGYATGAREETLREAEWVLIGESAIWFCAYFIENPTYRDRQRVCDDMLVIKYLRDRDYAQELVNAHPRRRLSRIDLVSYRTGQDMSHHRTGRPSWTRLTESVSVGARSKDPKDEEFLKALDFLIDYQAVELNARKYPFIRTERAAEDTPAGDTPQGTAVLMYDQQRDDERKHRNALLTVYAMDPGRRPHLGDFVADLGSDDDDFIKLDVVGTPDRPHFGRDRIQVRVLRRLDAHSVEVRRIGGGRIPASGWLRPSTDSGSDIQLGRQARAWHSLRNLPGLIRALREPLSFDLGRGRYNDADDSGLEGNAPSVIREMLSLHPFYALQGPPGTGKTTVATHAVSRYLRMEKGARILVSAQSNFALDNLGIRLAEELGDGIDKGQILMLREMPQMGGIDKVDPRLHQHTLEALTRRVVSNIEHKLGGGPGGSGARTDVTPSEAALVQQWLERVVPDQVEISDRIKAGANIVLATCSMAATITDTVRDPSDLFDWVLLEEAAKAWPTEVVTPLVLGVRWTLIGDHRQLGPHRENDVRAFLHSLYSHPDPDVQRHYDARESYLKVLSLFGELFRTERERPAQSRQVPPLGSLDKQFRMHRTIAEPASRAFYPKDPVEQDPDLGLPNSFLTTHEAANVPHSVREPWFLEGHPLVWLDTTGRPGCADEGYWTNVGEVDLVDRLVTGMDPAPPDPSLPDAPGSLAVLTPYAAQVALLNQRGSLRNRVHTVHSFQGREAHRVVVSLVRSTRRGDVLKSVGHVGQAEVINVLMSRARRLLVMVGSLEHFAEHGGQDWRLVTDTVKRFGKVVRADEWE